MMKKFTFFAVLMMFGFLAQAQNPKSVIDALNPGFEGSSPMDTCYYWYSEVSGAAKGAVGYTKVGAKEGARCLRAEVTTKGANPWEVQAFHTEYETFTKGVDYILRFWAKSPTTGATMRAMVQESAPTYGTPAQETITLTTSWKQYTVNFNLGVDTKLHPVFHFADGAGVFFLDYLELGKKSDLLVGANDLNLDNKVTISPNPTTGLIDVKATEDFDNLYVYDMTGRMVSSFAYSGSNQFDVSNLANGVYQIAVTSKKGMAVSKLVKM
jgi:Secretion system C-terminal sorting domain/Carbohydrate binding domain